MAHRVRQCFIRCVTGSHPDILLPPNQTTLLGRGPETKVKDKRCSRKQIVLVADVAALNVKVKQLGDNSSTLRGCPIGKDNEVRAKHGDEVELLEGQFKYKILFEPPPPIEKSSEDATTLKRKMNDEASSSSACHVSVKMPKLDLEPKLTGTNGDFKWHKVCGGEVFVMTHASVRHSEKIASFDMDGTLICTQSGRVFPLDHNDWKILFAEIPGKLKQLHADGYKIVVLTNQAGIAKGKTKIEDFRTKVQNVAKRLGVPLQLFCCAADGGMFRKPRTGVWRLLTEEMNGGISVDMAESFYCGDAAGRHKDWQKGKKKDFSCSDRLFALNLGLAFRTPEQLFLGHKPTDKFSLPEFNPKSVMTDNRLDPETAQFDAGKQEMVLMVGIQGSGKSYIAENKFHPLGYVVASNDKSGGREKTLKLAVSSLERGKSVVVDNTHGEKETRKKFLDVARKFKVPARCFVMQTDPNHARHNNLFRELTGSDHARIKEVLFHSYKSKYQEPTLDEGYEAIVKVNFVPEFKNEAEANLYRTYLQEK